MCANCRIEPTWHRSCGAAAIMWVQCSDVVVGWTEGVSACDRRHQASLYDVYAATVLWAYANYTVALSSKTLCRMLSNQCMAKARCMNWSRSHCDALAQSEAKQGRRSGYNMHMVTDVPLFACIISHKWLVTVWDLLSQDQWHQAWSAVSKHCIYGEAQNITCVVCKVQQNCAGLITALWCNYHTSSTTLWSKIKQYSDWPLTLEELLIYQTALLCIWPALIKNLLSKLTCKQCCRWHLSLVVR